MPNFFPCMVIDKRTWSNLIKQQAFKTTMKVNKFQWLKLTGLRGPYGWEIKKGSFYWFLHIFSELSDNFFNGNVTKLRRYVEFFYCRWT